MNQQLKQRLVGVAVIFLLAIIFLPMILDGSGYQDERVDIEIPPPPVITSRVKVEEKVIELKKQTAQIPSIAPFIVDEESEASENTESTQSASGDSGKQEDDNRTIEGALARAKQEPQVEKPAEPKKVEQPSKPKVIAAPAKPVQQAKPAIPKTGGETFVIQVGSFGEKNRAFALRDKLRKGNLASVFIEKYQHQGNTRYRVRMGPFLTHEKGNVINNKLLAKYNIKGLVMGYEK